MYVGRIPVGPVLVAQGHVIPNEPQWPGCRGMHYQRDTAADSLSLWEAVWTRSIPEAGST